MKPRRELPGYLVGSIREHQMSDTQEWLKRIAFESGRAATAAEEAAKAAKSTAGSVRGIALAVFVLLILVGLVIAQGRGLI